MNRSKIIIAILVLSSFLLVSCGDKKDDASNIDRLGLGDWNNQLVSN